MNVLSFYCRTLLQPHSNLFCKFPFVCTYKVVERLLQDPTIDVNVQNIADGTSLIFAAQKGYRLVVEMLLADPDIDLSVTAQDGSTAFDFAIANEYTDIADLLLEGEIGNADPRAGGEHQGGSDTCSSDQFNNFCVAILDSNVKKSSRFIHRWKNLPETFNRIECNGMTPLMLSSSKGQIEVR